GDLETRLRIPQDPPADTPLLPALSRLPPSYDSAAYWPFLAMYGTHYIGQAVLDGLTASDIKACLVSQFSLNLGLGPLPSNSAGREWSSHWYKWLSQAAWSTAPCRPGVFSAWVESLKTSPSLVSYSPTPSHTLVGPDDPRREALRQAAKKYVAERGQRRSCPRSFPEEGKTYSWDPCKCDCSMSRLTDSTCCSHERGMAQMKVHLLRAEDLWEDPTSATDAYVRFLFQGQRLQTGYGEEDNDPI
ncbi:unnamed protein product, partial [Lepidochelys olivacea]